jgi:hypothetical protein
MKFIIYYISDRTAITSEAFGKTLVSQFKEVRIEEITHRFVDNAEKARKVADEINAVSKTEANLPVVFSTLVNESVRNVIQNTHCHFFDLFNLIVPELERVFKTTATYSLGLAHGSAHDASYEQRMDAVNFSLVHDDGVGIDHYDKAEIILTGVSRTGKTPTCLYLAMHYGIYAANYPLTEENFKNDEVPQELKKHKSRVFALTIKADRLQKIRDARMPNTTYSSLGQCQSDIRKAEDLFRKLSIPVLDVTASSVEEIATTVLNAFNE